MSKDYRPEASNSLTLNYKERFSAPWNIHANPYNGEI